MKSIFKNAIIAAALVFGAASISNAQVKVGNNPATIGANSNLEVEATNGNKTIVNKATGQITIQDGTQGAAKVLTSDANGASSWQTAVAQPSPEVLLSVRLTTPVLTGGGTIIYGAKNFDKGNNFTLPSTFTAPSDGYYQLMMSVGTLNQVSPNGRGFRFTVAGSQNYWHQLSDEGVSAGNSHATSASTIIFLKAGDTVTTQVTAVNYNYTLASAELVIMKVSNSF